MTTKETRTILPVNGIGPGSTVGARKLAERRAEKLARQRRSAGPADWLIRHPLALDAPAPDRHAQAQRELDASAMGEEVDP